MYLLGFDIGGTKCAVITAEWENGAIKILKRSATPTIHTVSAYMMIEKLIEMADAILERKPDSIGISCGGPLDSSKGIIMSPPNLPGWDNIEIKRIMEEHYKTECKLQNDANASAIAEWKFGAGRGTENMVFLTFGTGLGAGLILGGRLYEGTNGNAGELGHIRLSRTGPVGYGKRGSFEGFCSGGGIAQLGYSYALKAIKKGDNVLYFKKGMTKKDVSAKSIALAAENGDKTAIKVYADSGKYLGRGLAIAIDILNPEKIVIGSIFRRSGKLLTEAMQKEIEREALGISASVCEVVPAELGEEIGDYAAIATAII